MKRLTAALVFVTLTFSLLPVPAAHASDLTPKEAEACIVNAINDDRESRGLHRLPHNDLLYEWTLKVAHETAELAITDPFVLTEAPIDTTEARAMLPKVIELQWSPYVEASGQGVAYNDQVDSLSWAQFCQMFKDDIRTDLSWYSSTHPEMQLTVAVSEYQTDTPNGWGENRAKQVIYTSWWVAGWPNGECVWLTVDDGSWVCNPIEMMDGSDSDTTTDPSSQFSDVEGSVFRSDIDALAASGITKGCNPPANDRFCPDDVVTRGQMAAFLVRALSLSKGKATFSDTKGHIFAADIAALADAGITKGCNPPPNDRFCPDDRVTRGQMAAFLVRALKLPKGKASFKDTAGHVFAADVASLADAGITKGCNPPRNDRFCPDDYVTRGQMAAFLVRAGLAG